MGRLVVQYPDTIEVALNGVVAGHTNQVLQLDPGDYTVQLVGEPTDPETHQQTISNRSDAIVHVAFSPRAERVDRFSELYCAYNGFLLGQFLSLAFSDFAARDYAVRLQRMRQFLEEVDVVVAIPDVPRALGSEAHTLLVAAVLDAVAARSPMLTDFALLGALLPHYGIQANEDAEAALATAEQIEDIRARLALPPVDLEEFSFEGPGRQANDLLSPSLAYLAEIIRSLDVEADTAFVIMPFREPYASYFATFYRPTLEESGRRAFRAWGGLATEDYSGVLLALIAKSGMVWADISELNQNVFYEIGAAHALGKLSMIVVREDDAESLPANIGHDAVFRYSDRGDDWPTGTVVLMAMIISTLDEAVEAQKGTRVSPAHMENTIAKIKEEVEHTLTVPAALTARADGARKMQAGDYAGAERAYDEAYHLGLDDVPTLLGRGWSRMELRRFAEAERDLDEVLVQASAGEGERQVRALAARFRAMARNAQGNIEGALADYTLAIELAAPEAELFAQRGSIYLIRGQRDLAEADAERARAISPDDEALEELEELLASE